MPKYSRDSGFVQAAVSAIVNSSFPALDELRFLCTVRTDLPALPIVDRHTVKVRKVAPKYRDVLNCDVEIEICEGLWNKIDELARNRLLYRALRRISLKRNMIGELITDTAGRTKVDLNQPEVDLDALADEINRHGIADEYGVKVQRLVNAIKARLASRRAEVEGPAPASPESDFRATRTAVPEITRIDGIIGKAMPTPQEILAKGSDDE